MGRIVAVKIGGQGFWRKSGLLATAALCIAVAGAPAAVRAQTKTSRQAPATFDIAAQDLGAALTLFSDRAGLRLLVASSVVRGKRSAPVSGRLTREQALDRLLSGTGLSYRFPDSNTVTIVDLFATGAGGGPADLETGSTALQQIVVDGEGETGWGPVDGLVAEKSVTGSKTDTPIIEIPQSVSVVTADQAREQGAQTVSEALRYTPGIDSEAYGFDARFNHFTVRGFQIDKFQFVDGLKFPAGGYAIARIEPYGLERLEVLRGPSSGLYGQNVPGGMINLVSKRPTDDPVREVQLGTAYPGRIQGAFDFGGPVNGEETLLYRLTGAGSYGDTQVRHTTDQRLFLAPAFTFKPEEGTKLTILSHIQKDNVDGWSGTFLPIEGTLLPNPNGRIPTDTFVGEPGFDHYRRDQYAIGYEFEHAFSDALTFRSNARYADIDVDAPNIYPSFLDPVDKRTLQRSALRFRDHVRSFTVDNSLEARFEIGPTEHTLLAGIDYQHLRDRDRFDLGDGPTPPLDIFDPDYGADLPSLVPLTDNDIKQNQVGIYLQDQIRFDNWLLTLGGRQDWVSGSTTDMITPGPATKTDDHAFTGRVGLAYLFDNGVAPYMSYSTSFEPVIGTTYEGTPFVPTTGQQYEAGIKYQPPGLDVFLSAALYELRQQNVLTDDTREDAPPFSQIQEGEVRVRGFEVEAKASVWSGWDLIGSYTFADTVTTKSNSVVGGVPVEGKAGANVPRHQAALWAKYTIEDGALAGLGLGAGVRYRSSLYGDNINTIKVPAVTLVDAALSYDFGKANPEMNGLVLNVNASNLLGKEFVSNCAGEVCYYGPDRSVTATLTYRW